ncbi:MAG TPA: hypothetical protein VHU84_18335 [Lacipirellulaceae bacterium]|nr:hypothetical protein [Lacipirellulaceae bacterium]
MVDSSFQALPAELREAIESFVEHAVDQKLQELLGNPDEGLEVREELIQRLQKQQQRVASGERGQSMEEVMRELELQ